MAFHDHIFPHSPPYSNPTHHHDAFTEIYGVSLSPSVDISQTETLSNHTSVAMLHHRPISTSPINDGDLSCTHRSHVDGNSSEQSPCTEWILSGQVQLACNLYPYPSTVAHIPEDPWIQEPDSRDGFDIIYSPEYEDRGDPTFTSSSSHRLTHDHDAGVFNTTLCYNTPFPSEGWASPIMLVSPVQDAMYASSYRNKSAERFSEVEQQWENPDLENCPLFTVAHGVDGAMYTDEDLYDDGRVCVDTEVCHIPTQHNTYSFSGHVKRKSIDSSSQGIPSSAGKEKHLCPMPGCKVKFSLKADITRHLRTKHKEPGEGHRCDIEGCLKFGKVWKRLDSFKNHVKIMHKDANVADMVQRSNKKDPGLPISVTTPVSMSRRSTLQQ